MKRVLITGMSGTGKSTVISGLAARGYKAVDADYGGLSELVNIPASNDRSGLGREQDWIWREDRVTDLLATEDADVLFLSGTASNQVKFYDQFDQIVLLTAPASVMIERLVHRTNNPYGKSPKDLARALALKESVEPLLRRAADLEVDTSIPIDDVVEKIVGLIMKP